MPTHNGTAPADAQPSSISVLSEFPEGYSEHTADRILAWLESLCPLDPDAPDTHEYARSLIYRIARSVGNDPHGSPTLRLTGDEAAEVLRFIAQTQPREPATWWTDPTDAPSRVCGFHEVLYAVINSIDPPAGLGIAS